MRLHKGGPASAESNVRQHLSVFGRYIGRHGKCGRMRHGLVHANHQDARIGIGATHGGEPNW